MLNSFFFMHPVYNSLGLNHSVGFSVKTLVAKCYMTIMIIMVIIIVIMMTATTTSIMKADKQTGKASAI